MSDYNDAECAVHGIQWSSQERGGDCPACAAEHKIWLLKKQVQKLDKVFKGDEDAPWIAIGKIIGRMLKIVG